MAAGMGILIFCSVAGFGEAEGICMPGMFVSVCGDAAGEACGICIPGICCGEDCGAADCLGADDCAGRFIPGMLPI